MELITNQSGKVKSASEILRQYRVYNPNLAIAPLQPGTDQHWLDVPIEHRYRRTTEWQPQLWPDGANVAIATGTRNRLIVINLSTNSATTEFIDQIADHGGDLSPYAVRTPIGVQWYYRTRYDRESIPTVASTIDTPGFKVIAEGQYVVAAGSLISGCECKALLDQTLDVAHLPVLPKYFADALGFAEKSTFESSMPSSEAVVGKFGIRPKF